MIHAGLLGVFAEQDKKKKTWDEGQASSIFIMFNEISLVSFF